MEYRSFDCDTYKMEYANPHLSVEPLEQEIKVVHEALDMLESVGIIANMNYDGEKLLAHRKAVAELFEIPWTAITHRMQRLLYAVNAIAKPNNMLAAGIFCGNTFISNAGAGVGPGAAYTANDLVGIEIKPDEAERAERNVRRLDPTGVAHIVAADAVAYAANYAGEINLLYLDADGDVARGKGIYFDILQAAWDKMPKGTVVMAHNSVNCAERLKHYLEWVRDPANMAASVNVIFDVEGLEVSVK